MEVLVVSPNVPYDGVPHAGGVFLFHHLEQLSSSAHLTLLAPLDHVNEEAASRVPPWLEVVLAPQYPPAHSSARYLTDRLLYQLHGRSPFAHLQRALQDADLVGRARRADLVELHWPEYAHLAPYLRRSGVSTPLVVIDHDVASDLEAHSIRLSGGPRRLVALSLRGLHRWTERRALNAADLILVFKQADGSLLRQLGVRTAFRVVDPWLDAPSRRPSGRDGRTVLFTAAMWREENDLSARWLLREVWPEVCDAVPHATLVLAGAGPTSTLRREVAKQRSVVLTGWVPDLEPCYLAASVFVAPLLHRGGLKFKIPQAMLYELPIVATTAAAEGVAECAPAGTFWAVTDDPAQFARSLIGALQQPERSAQTGERAAHWARQQYSFARTARLLAQDYALLTSEPTLR